MKVGVRYQDVAAPYGGIWSSPFARWRGSLAAPASLDVGVWVTRRALATRRLPAEELRGLVLGWTVPQPAIFYGGPVVAARLGLPSVTGPMVSQACATSVAALHQAAGSVLTGAGAQLVVVADRTSRGPVLDWPRASAGQEPETENWVLDSFRRDPLTGVGMLATAEALAAKAGFTRADADRVAVLRGEQYAASMADSRAFQRRFLVEVAEEDGRVLLAADEGCPARRSAWPGASAPRARTPRRRTGVARPGAHRP